MWSALRLFLVLCSTLHHFLPPSACCHATCLAVFEVPTLTIHICPVAPDATASRAHIVQVCPTTSKYIARTQLVNPTRSCLHARGTFPRQTCSTLRLWSASNPTPPFSNDVMMLEFFVLAIHDPCWDQHNRPVGALGQYSVQGRYTLPHSNWFPPLETPPKLVVLSCSNLPICYNWILIIVETVQLPSTKLEDVVELHLTTKFVAPNLCPLAFTSLSDISSKSFQHLPTPFNHCWTQALLFQLSTIVTSNANARYHCNVTFTKVSNIQRCTHMAYSYFSA